MSPGDTVADCLFCGIVSGEIPATIVREGRLSLAFRDLNPVAPTHLLIVPKAHVDDVSEIGEHHGELLAEMVELAAALAREEEIEATGYRLVFNVGDDAGNTVGHLHLHLVGGRKMAWPPG